MFPVAIHTLQALLVVGAWLAFLAFIVAKPFR